MSDGEVSLAIAAARRGKNVLRRIDDAISQKNVRFKCSSPSTYGKHAISGETRRDYVFIYSINNIAVRRREFVRALSLRKGESVEDFNIVYSKIVRNCKPKGKKCRLKNLQKVFVTQTVLRAKKPVGDVEHAEIGSILETQLLFEGMDSKIMGGRRNCPVEKIEQFEEFDDFDDEESSGEGALSLGERMCMVLEEKVLGKRKAGKKPYQCSFISAFTGAIDLEFTFGDPREVDLDSTPSDLDEVAKGIQKINLFPPD